MTTPLTSYMIANAEDILSKLDDLLTEVESEAREGYQKALAILNELHDIYLQKLDDAREV